MARTAHPTITHNRSDRTESVYIMTGGVASGSLIPTQAELDASTTYDVTVAIAANGVVGFETDRTSITVPIMGTSSFPVRLAGPKETGDASISMWADKLGVDIRSILDETDIVHVVFAPNGDTPASYLECWKCEVTSISRPKEFSATPTKVRVKFDIQNANERALIPA